MWLTIALGLAAAVLMGAGVALAVRAAMRSSRRRADAIACPFGTEWSGYVKINGVAQWLLIRGEDARNPLLLFCMAAQARPKRCSQGGATRLKSKNRKIAKHFVAVHWEQRGTCKSYSTALERTPLTNEQLVSDVDAVSRYLLATYHRHKLYLIGHSWGSWLGIVAITDNPELYHAFIGVGQSANSIEQERISLHFTLDYLTRRGDMAGFARLAAIGEPPYARPFEDIMRQ